MKLQGFNL